MDTEMQMELFKTKYRLIWRWSLFTAGLITLFWAACYLVYGEVPQVSKHLWKTYDDDGGTIFLTVFPAVSRWWDILIGPYICIFFFNGMVKIGLADAKSRAIDYGFIAAMSLIISLVVSVFLFLANETNMDITGTIATYGIAMGALVCGIVISIVTSCLRFYRSAIGIIDIVEMSFALNLLVGGPLLGIVMGVTMAIMGAILTLIVSIVLVTVIFFVTIAYRWLTLKS